MTPTPRPASTGSQSKHVGWVIRGTRFAGPTLMVFIVLAERANERGVCWPSVASIAEDSRCSERSAQYALRTLEQAGWIAVKRQRSRSGTNLYHLNLARLEQSFLAAEQQRREREAAEAAALEAAFAPEVPEISYAPSVPKACETTSAKAVDNLLITCGNPVDGGEQGVQLTTPKGAAQRIKGCSLVAPEPQEPPRTPIDQSQSQKEPTTATGVFRFSTNPKSTPSALALAHLLAAPHVDRPRAHPP